MYACARASAARIVRRASAVLAGSVSRVTLVPDPQFTRTCSITACFVFWNAFLCCAIFQPSRSLVAVVGPCNCPHAAVSIASRSAWSESWGCLSPTPPILRGQRCQISSRNPLFVCFTTKSDVHPVRTKSLSEKPLHNFKIQAVTSLRSVTACLPLPLWRYSCLLWQT